MIIFMIVALIPAVYYYTKWRKDHGEDFAENFNRLTPEMKDDNYYGLLVSTILGIILILALTPAFA